MLVMACAVSPARAQDETPADTLQAAPGSTDERSAQIESIVEQLQAIQSEVDKQKRFKFSGYLQARYENAEDSDDSLRISGTPPAVTVANRNRFYIRRARLKLTYDSSPLSQGVIYFDGGTDRTVRLLEAYVTLLDPWTVEHRHSLTVGQFNVPFGYEIERSSSVRELPERSRAENVLFPGERDRGLKVVSQWTDQLETVVSVLNGGGISHPLYANTDPTGMKDLTGRVRWSQGVFDVAASYYWGDEATPLVGPDVETDKTRLGFDAQIFYEAPSIGGGTLRGEFYSGENLNADSLRALAPPPAGQGTALLRPGNLATDFVGGYVMWVQNFGDRAQVAVRWDTFDPNVDKDHDEYWRLGTGLNFFPDGNVRITVSYDFQNTETAGGSLYQDPKDNLWTIQFQHKF